MLELSHLSKTFHPGTVNEKKALDDLSLDEFREISPVFAEDVYDAISMKTCIAKRNTVGAPGPEAMRREIEACRSLL